MAEKTGTRPSQFFEWNEPEEWQNRFMFDMHCIMTYNNEKNKQMNKSIKKRRK